MRNSLAGLLFVIYFSFSTLLADDGYKLWLRFDLIQNTDRLEEYREAIPFFHLTGESLILQTAKGELQLGLSGLLGKEIEQVDTLPSKGLIVGILGQTPSLDKGLTEKVQTEIGEEGFSIFIHENNIYLLGKDEQGVLYGVFRLLFYLKKELPLDKLTISDAPSLKLRLLNHWDNLDGTVERGYAGFSIWNWHQLPDYLDPRYKEYARANASIGINGTVITNVNANSLVFREDYLKKAAALADIFRAYGIKLYLTARFSSPMELGDMDTADPLNREVQEWWQDKVDEIYRLIPDFGGFLVKANSEGQPGPQQFGRTHADGANMLADALAPHEGIVMWRAFVYRNEESEDRAKQAYNEFVPLDGQFRENVMIQVKNGPIDFQPREPIHPLFGGMTQTPVMMEFQVTKEYLGQGTHLVGLAPMYEEVLQTDTHQEVKNSTVGDILEAQRLSGMAGVSNIGTSRNWTGHLFGQADWYAYGRFSWNTQLTSSDIYEEWTQLSFEDTQVQQTARELLLNSHEACVKYMTPLGLHHLMATGHHYGPGPWVDNLGRGDWNPVYYHKADEVGIGFDRTESGSNALGQYAPAFSAKYEDRENCPLEYLLWFHHVPWTQKLPTGNTLWEQLCREYQEGVDLVSDMRTKWNSLEGMLDAERYMSVKMHLKIQEKEARWWRDACLTYFQTFSNLPIPEELEQPEHDLKYYQSISHPYAPGIKPRW